VSTRTAPYFARVVTVLISALGLALLMSPGSDAQGPTIVINEIQPRNSTTILDGDDDFEDWTELPNMTGADIDSVGSPIEDSTTGWTIQPDPSFPNKTIVPTNGFLLIWASDKGDPLEPGSPGPAHELHANFKLSGTKDVVRLSTSSIPVSIVTRGPVDVLAGFSQDKSHGRHATGALVVFTPGEVTRLALTGATSTPTPAAVAGPAGIVINEVMQANTLTVADGDSQFEDWFELYNPIWGTLDMTGWTVRDSTESWQLPNGTVLATALDASAE
jgi:hypothetical protein